MAKPTLEQLVARDYGVRIWRTGDRFVLEVEELSLAVDAEALDDAWQALEARKREYFEAMIAAGRGSAVPAPASAGAAGDFWRRFLPFMFKTGFAAVVFAAVVLSVGPALKHQFREVGREAREAGREWPNGLFEGLASFKGLNEERRQRAVEGVRRLVDSLGPVIDEARKGLAAHDKAAGTEAGESAAPPPAR